MATRNFWLEGRIDGQKTKIEGGPRSKDGGFTLTVKMRDNGGISKPLIIEGRANEDGSLVLVVEGKGFSITDDKYGTMLRKVTPR